MIPIEDARALILHPNPDRVSRMAWRAAWSGVEYRDAAVMLHLGSGHVYAVAPVAIEDELLPGEIFVCFISAERRRVSESIFSGGRGGVSSSADVIEETATRHARRWWLSGEHWRLIERQLEAHYGRRVA